MPEKPEQKRVTGLRVHEISLVDDPAVPAARFLIVKRRDGGAAVAGKTFIPVDVIEKICAPCGAKLRAKGFKAISLDELKKQREFATETFCDKFGAEEGFRTRCMEEMTGVDEPGAFCNWLENECHGTFERRAKAAGKCVKCGHAKIDPKDLALALKVLKAAKDEACPAGQVWDYDEGKCVPEGDKHGRNAKAKEKDGAKLQREGFLLQNGEEPVCPEGFMWSEEDGRCLKEEPVRTKKQEDECPEGMIWDSDAEECVDEETFKAHRGYKKQDCPPWLEWDEEKGKCVGKKKGKAKKEGCPEGHEWDDAKGECVAMKAKKQDCPEGQKWDADKGECVPAGEAEPAAKGSTGDEGSVAKAAADVKLDAAGEAKIAELLKG